MQPLLFSTRLVLMGPCSILGYFSSWGPYLFGTRAKLPPPPLGGPEVVIRVCKDYSIDLDISHVSFTQLWLFFGWTCRRFLIRIFESVHAKMILKYSLHRLASKKGKCKVYRQLVEICKDMMGTIKKMSKSFQESRDQYEKRLTELQLGLNTTINDLEKQGNDYFLCR